MFKKLSVFLLMFALSISIPKPVLADEISVSAKAAILICADSSQVVFSKNETQRLSMASTTKIMTSLLTIEESQASNREVTITDKMVRVEGSSMGLRAGDIVTLDALAKGMLMCSGNDAANSAAIAIAGDEQNFAKLMNQRALQIGMNNTNFVTPSGLDDENHYTTAYDMAILGAYAMENPTFKDIASQKSMSVDFINPPKRVSYSNHNRLITLYKGCIGIKTGFTKKSGRCLVSCAERDGVRLVAVTLNAPDDWNDHINMFDYGFAHVQKVTLDDTNLNLQEPIVSSDIDTIPINTAKPLNLTVLSTDASKITKKIKVPEFLYAPVDCGQIVGSISYELNGKVLASADLIASAEAPIQQEQGFWSWLRNLFNR